MLQTKFHFHSQNFKDWLRQGGPINPTWARETMDLKRDLHRAQCRAARRIFAAQQEANSRCLGAFEVYRRQRQLEARRQQPRRASRYESTRDEIPAWQQQPPQHGQQQQYSQQPDAVEQKLTLEELVPACNAIGRFERFGDRDIAFSCDFCDGFIVWEDLAGLPADRTPLPVTVTNQPNWQATGKSVSTGEEKTVVFAPLAIANHSAPEVGDWLARILCPYCDDYKYYDQGDEDEGKYAQDEAGFGSLKAFQEHLEWSHSSMAVPVLPPLPVFPSLPTSAENCRVM